MKLKLSILLSVLLLPLLVASPAFAFSPTPSAPPPNPHGLSIASWVDEPSDNPPAQHIMFDDSNAYQPGYNPVDCQLTGLQDNTVIQGWGFQLVGLTGNTCYFSDSDLATVTGTNTTFDFQLIDGSNNVIDDSGSLAFCTYMPNTCNSAPSLNPVMGASVSALTSSIPQTAASFVLSSFVNVLPYILLLVGLFVAYRYIKKFMGRQEGISNGWVDEDGNINTDGDADVWGKNEADIWQSDFNENGKINVKEYEKHWQENIADVKVFQPESSVQSQEPENLEHWTESAGGIEEHMTSEGDSTFYDRS